jgi:hypothetical protein
MRTKLNLVCLVGGSILVCLLVSSSDGQSAEKEIKGMLRDALGGSKETVAINDSNQKLHLRLDGKRCVVNGGSNVIRINGQCTELLVNGTGNRIRVERVGGVRVLGANNTIIYESGVSAAKPDDVRILGAGSSVAQSESEGKKEDRSAKSDANQKQGLAGGAGVVIAENNNSSLTKTIADGSPLTLSGNNNSVEITGSASTLTISGNNNEIHIDGVESVIFRGNNNEVYYKKGENPKTTGSGLNNAVERQE